jgi:hypothetical protein
MPSAATCGFSRQRELSKPGAGAGVGNCRMRAPVTSTAGCGASGTWFGRSRLFPTNRKLGLQAAGQRSSGCFVSINFSCAILPAKLISHMYSQSHRMWIVEFVPKAHSGCDVIFTWEYSTGTTTEFIQMPATEIPNTQEAASSFCRIWHMLEPVRASNALRTQS